MPSSPVQNAGICQNLKKPMTSSFCRTFSYGTVLLVVLIVSICASPVRSEGPALRLPNVAGKLSERRVQFRSAPTPAFVESKSVGDSKDLRGSAGESKDNLKSLSKSVASVFGVLVLGVSMTLPI
jgi:hypothetical protein